MRARLKYIAFLIGMARRNNWRSWSAIWTTSRPAASLRRQQTVEVIIAMQKSGLDSSVIRRVDGKVIEIGRPERAA